MHPDREESRKLSLAQALANWKAHIPRNREERRKQLSKHKYYLVLEEKEKAYVNHDSNQTYGVFGKPFKEWKVYKVKKDGTKTELDSSDKYGTYQSTGPESIGSVNNEQVVEAAPLKNIEPSIDSLDGQATIKGAPLIAKPEGTL